jgi:hypothetical protein
VLAAGVDEVAAGALEAAELELVTLLDEEPPLLVDPLPPLG